MHRCYAYKDRNNRGTCFLWDDGTIEVNGDQAAGRPEWMRKDPEFLGTFGPLLPHDGSACPIDPNATIIARMRESTPYIGPAVHPQHGDPEGMWRHGKARSNGNPKYDIVAYQVQVA